jgi:hypothetical protein
VLDASDIANFRIALAANAGTVNALRMEYAIGRRDRQSPCFGPRAVPGT